MTGEAEAFYEMCMTLPDAIKDVLDAKESVRKPNDSVFNELKNKSATNSFELALYMLSFETYSGFKENFFRRRSDVS